MKSMGLFIIISGLVLILIGLLVMFSDKIPYLGKLPGDINISGDKGNFHFPVTTCIIISIVLTVLGNIVARFFK